MASEEREGAPDGVEPVEDAGEDDRRHPLNRRRVLGYVAGAGLAAALAGTVATRLMASPGTAPTAANRLNDVLNRLNEPPTQLELAAVDVPPGRDPRAVANELVDAARDAGNVEITLGFGSTWFDKAGPTVTRPAGLVPMPAFVGDVVSDNLAHGDLLLHIAADGEGAARDRTQSLLAAAHLTPRWRKRGFRPDTSAEHGRTLTRNLFGYTEGHANPPLADNTTATEAALIPAHAADPAWTAGGSHLVVRIIRFAQELWDAEPRAHLDRVIGRRPDGVWLDGTAADRAPAFTADPDGAITPLDSHVRSANPRTASTPPPRLVRRSYSYRDGRDPQGLADDGLLFIALQADLATGFTAVQNRLTGQALDRYTLTIGGGYYFIPDLTRPAAQTALLGRPRT